MSIEENIILFIIKQKTIEIDDLIEVANKYRKSYSSEKTYDEGDDLRILDFFRFLEKELNQKDKGDPNVVR